MRQLGNGPAMHAYVAYTGGKSGGQSSGTVNGSSTWGASRAIQLHAGNLAGWQQAQYTFVGDKGASPALRLLRRSALRLVDDRG